MRRGAITLPFTSRCGQKLAPATRSRSLPTAAAPLLMASSTPRVVELTSLSSMKAQLPHGCAPGSKEWAAFNEAAQEAFNAETLAACPHCLRKFNADVADRHIPKCNARKR